MAIGYANMRVIHSGPSSSAIGLLAYMKRCKLVDEVTGKVWIFTETNEGEDLLADGVVLPDGAPDRYLEPSILVNDLQRKELVLDRKSRTTRYRSGAQLARTETLAMPRELDLEEWKAMLVDFAKETYASRNVPVVWAIHDASGDQPHAHLLISTRYLDPETGKIGKKARELNPEFAKGRLVKDRPGLRWAAFQERWAASRGIQLKVDPYGPVPQKRRGKGRFLGEKSEAVIVADVAEEANREALRDPVMVLAALSAQMSTWSENDLGRMLRPLPLRERNDARSRILRHASVVALERGRYSTVEVIEQERGLVAMAQAWLGGASHAADKGKVAAMLGAAEGVAHEQVDAILECTGAEQLAIVRDAGGHGGRTGINLVRDAYRASGRRVVGLAPTNMLAEDMGSSGFREFGTLHRLLACQEKRIDPPWDMRTVLIVDGASMVDTETMARLFQRVQQSGAKVLLVGDERRFPSVRRGGLYAELRRRFGGPELTTPRRPDHDWRSQAQLDLVEGRIAAAVEALASNGCVTAGDGAIETRLNLLRDWAASYNAEPGRRRFIFTHSDEEAADLNGRIQLELERVGHVRDIFSYSTLKGDVAAGVGDRIQFHASNRKAGYLNGQVGTISGRGANGTLLVSLDSGGRAVLDPRVELRWSLGYAGSIHRMQGMPLAEAFHLHSPGGEFGARDLAGARQAETLRIYYSTEETFDLRMLAQQIASRADLRVAASFLDGVEAPSAIAREFDPASRIVETRPSSPAF